jgi:perosamine synthetase
MRYLTERGVSCAVHYPKPIYNQPLYKKLGYDGKCKIAEDASRKVLSIPVHPALQQNELRYIVECINDFQ